MTGTTFKQAYGILKGHAETLRNEQEPNIDNLLTIVTESVAAYKVCKERIDAVEKALEKALSGADINNRNAEDEDEPIPSLSTSGPEFDEPDIPF